MNADIKFLMHWMEDRLKRANSWEEGEHNKILNEVHLLRKDIESYKSFRDKLTGMWIAIVAIGSHLVHKINW